MASILKSAFPALGWAPEDSQPARPARTVTANVTVLERPSEPTPYVPVKYSPEPAEIKAYGASALKEYIDVAEAVGIAPPDLVVEKFKLFLIESGFTVFSRASVAAFMDEKCRKETDGVWGWQWRPLREKDKLGARFGRAASRQSEIENFGGPVRWIGDADGPRRADTPASDYYRPEIGVYSQVVPLHALKKVAQIEKGFGHPVHFMVSDYAPAPAFRVDPFLMAVVPNANIARGDGRFIIDVWDEPGFGIEQMLQSDVL